MSFAKKMNIWKDTIKKCKSSNFRPLPSVKYDYTEISKKKKYRKTYINVLDMDSIHCGKELLMRGYYPVVLNMADDCFPGGHFQIGSGAQEESLFRRSNYFQTLNVETGFYPLKGAELIYSPKVTIIKDHDGNDLDNYFNLAFIACPAIKQPNLVDNKFTDEDKELFMKKIKNILNMAYHHGHDSVVLGARGCGAWAGPQEEIAHLFKKIVHEYIGLFANINFAILRIDKHEYIVKNKNLEKSNFDIFHGVFYDEGFPKKEDL